MPLCTHKEALPLWSLGRLMKGCWDCDVEDFHRDVKPIKVTINRHADSGGGERWSHDGPCTPENCPHARSLKAD